MSEREWLFDARDCHPPVYACCGTPGCDWTQAAPSLDDGFKLSAAHRKSHGGPGVDFPSATPLRPNALDYMLAYPEFFAWRAE